MGSNFHMVPLVTGGLETHIREWVEKRKKLEFGYDGVSFGILEPTIIIKKGRKKYGRIAID